MTAEHANDAMLIPPDIDDDVESVPRRIARTRLRSEARLILNLTAMIDVVFLLLIYFMVGTDFKLGEEIYRMDLPARAGAATERDPFELDEEPLRVAVATTGSFEGSYDLRLAGPYPQPHTFEAFHQFLAGRLIEDTSTGGLFAPDHPIVIEPAQGTRWEHAIGVFNAAARARYTNVTFAGPR